VAGLAIALALILALFVVGRRWWLEQRLRRIAALAPGASPERPLAVASFAAIEEEIEGRVCGRCGGRFVNLGERSARDGDRLLRVVRLECAGCEDLGWIHFDVTEAYQ
jgi:hypothetical protein